MPQTRLAVPPARVLDKHATRHGLSQGARRAHHDAGLPPADKDGSPRPAASELGLSCSNLDTARKLSESMGSYTAIAQSTSRTKGANTGSTGTSEGLVRRPLITPDELQRWTGRETGALVTHDGVPMAFPSRDVTETFVGPMLGMTSPDAERTLMEQSVARRETKNEAVPKVWNGPAVPDATAAEPARAKTVAGYVPEGF